MNKKSFKVPILALFVMASLSFSAVMAQEDHERPARYFDPVEGRATVGDREIYSEGAPRPRVIGEVTYRSHSIQPNTVLHITLKGDEPRYEDPGLTLKVSTIGTIRYPYIGEIEVLDMDEDELAIKIERLLERDYVRAPRVEVKILEKMVYWLLGDVEKPGLFDMPMDREITLREAIALAGGFKEDTQGITLFRDEWTSVKVTRAEMGMRKLYEFTLETVPEDFTVKPDDIILCKYGQIKELGSFYIFGEVRNPGKYPIVDDQFSGKKIFNRWGGWSDATTRYPVILGASNVVDAVMGAEGLTDNAARNWVYLVRQKENGRTRRYRIPMGRIFYKGEVDRYNMKLKDGDVITVSESWF